MGINSKGDLKPLSLVLMGGALFSMHFGAASMVWPMNWGKDAGTEVLLTFAGVFVTVVLLTLLAYVALFRSGMLFSETSEVVLGQKGGKIFSTVVITILCALYGVPRMGAATWDAICQASGYMPSNQLPLIIFSFVFYFLAYLFLSNPSKAMDRISKWLFPVLIVVVVAIIGKGLISPIGEPGAPAFSGNAFAYGFVEGYATQEILCALVFGSLILANLKEQGVAEERQSKNIIRVGIVGMGFLTCTHFGNMIIGASVSEVMPELTYTSLYTAVAFKLLGAIGGSVFIVAIFFAALTTAIGLGGAAGNFYLAVSNGKISYKAGVRFILFASAVMASMGLTSMLSWVGPVLYLIYPPTIVFVLYFTFMPNCLDKRRIKVCRWGMVVALFFGALDAIVVYMSLLGATGSVANAILNLYNALPFSADTMEWVPFSLIAAVLSYFIGGGSKSALENTSGN